ncbi:hypothetical protein P170DRAFT_270949 [Aspergillus steynii IBT 23096]|uniref:Uncharacterized protein n=1 Tax=Aspergillus steynii IBT 23096 TaxID=1392250 RepID=A0A2I2FWN7_9EURO|nr:uncharacterized protein P170DRAFT_270949 [Aspergillus steynii IBT 23096]PLB44976.1 hypothetical protein P170DRAFT_270949 [Aspergillus steynii IBT 23096]
MFSTCWTWEELGIGSGGFLSFLFFPFLPCSPRTIFSIFALPTIDDTVLRHQRQHHQALAGRQGRAWVAPTRHSGSTLLLRNNSRATFQYARVGRFTVFTILTLSALEIALTGLRAIFLFLDFAFVDTYRLDAASTFKATSPSPGRVVGTGLGRPDATVCLDLVVGNFSCATCFEDLVLEFCTYRAFFLLASVDSYIAR